MKNTLAKYIPALAIAAALPISAQAAPDPNFHIYLLLGQSNMVGAAHQADQPYTHERVRVLQDATCSTINASYGEWRAHQHPIMLCDTGVKPSETGQSKPIGLSPADSFAVEMAEAMDSGVTIGLVGAALGGSDIQWHIKNCGAACNDLASWQRNFLAGTPNTGSAGGYVWLMDMAKKAQEAGVIKGILMHHGENNAGSSAWLGQVKGYVNDIRTDLGLNADEVPFIAGELGYFSGSGGAQHNPIVQRIDDDPAQGGIENGYWVSAEGLTHRGDNLHFSTSGAIELGKRYADKMLEVGSFGPVDCGDEGGEPICCNISADPDRDGVGEQNDGQSCVVVPDVTAGWYPLPPADVAAAINVGGSGDAIEYNGIYYVSDRDYNGGQTNSTTDSVSNSGGSAVLQTERYGDYSYSIAVENGDYSVTLGMVEMYQTSNGSRSFNVEIEGAQVINALDIHAETGHDTALIREFDVTVNDGVLDVEVISIEDNGTLSSILVRSVGGGSSSSSLPSSSSSSSSISSSSSSSNSSSGDVEPNEPDEKAGAFGGLSLALLALVLGLFSRPRRRLR